MPPAEVPSPATISALSSQVEELQARVRAGAEASDRAPTEGLAAALFDAERALRAAHRALGRAERMRI